MANKIETEAMDNNKIILTMPCPHCGEKVQVEKPQTSGRHVYTCTSCGKKLALNTDDRQPNTRIINNDSGKLLHLFRERRFRSDEEYKLRIGENVIGRLSKKTPSDIMIDDDSISRRSVSITIERIEGGLYNYLFTLLKTTNPVFLNDKQILEGTSVYLKAGDKFIIGKNQFYIK